MSIGSIPKGIAFETAALKYLEGLFEQLGFYVTEARQQKSGTQNGFDIRIGFLDDARKERKFYFECKNYTNAISWNDVSVKILELHSSRHRADGYIALSPHVDFSNIHVNVIDNLAQTIQAPVKYWSPDARVEEYFSLDPLFFQYVYDREPGISPEKKAGIREKIRLIIIDMLRQKDGFASSLPTQELTLKIPRISSHEIVGREDEILEVHQLLAVGKQQVVVVNGLGGIGKTTLAQGYISAYFEEYRNVAWITQSTGDIVSDMANTEGLATKLSITQEGKDTQQLFYEILSKLKGLPGSPNLLVLDNVNDDLRKLKDYLPGQPHWHILTTSRIQIDGFYIKELGFLSPQQALALFKRHCSLITNDDDIVELLKSVDYHTLTIEILAKTAQFRRTDIDALKKALKDDLQANVFIRHSNERIDRVRSYLSSIFDLSGLAEDAIWLLKQFTCLPAEYHSYAQLLFLLGPGEDNREAFAECCNTLVAQGWLLYNTETDTYKMHVIVQEVTAQKLKIFLTDIAGLLEKITDVLKTDNADNPINRFKWIPFGYSILNIFRNDTAMDIAFLQNNLAAVLKSQGHYKQAHELMQRAMTSAEKHVGPEHPIIATGQLSLAMILKDLGHYEQARALLNHAINSLEKIFGPIHSYTAMSYSSLALVLKDLGQYEQACELMQKAVAVDEKNFGPEHRTTSASYSNLALILKELGRYEQARDLLQKSTASAERDFGPDHPTTTMRYSNLASVLKDLGQYEDACRLTQKVIHSMEKSLGPEHPSTVTNYSNLACMLTALGDCEQACALQRKVVVSTEKIFGPEHPTTTTSYSNLAIILRDLNLHEQALELLQKVTMSNEKNFGPEHPSTAVSYSNLAMVLKDLGQLEQALDFSQRAMTSAEKNFGHEHPTTATRSSNLAMILQDLGRYKEACDMLLMVDPNKAPEREDPAVILSYLRLASELQDKGYHELARELMQRTVLLAEINFGPENPATSVCHFRLASILLLLGQYEQACTLFQKATAADEKHFGPEHPHMATNYATLGLTLTNLGRYEQARELLLKAVTLAEREFGPEHPAIVVTCSNLALALQGLGHYEQALSLFQKVVIIGEKNFGPEHPNTAVSYTNLGLVLSDLGQQEQALVLLQKAAVSAEKNFGWDHANTKVNYLNLAGLLKELGRDEQADEILQKIKGPWPSSRFHVAVSSATLKSAGPNLA